MSSLIVMPGSEEFKKTLASIAKAPAAAGSLYNLSTS